MGRPPECNCRCFRCSDYDLTLDCLFKGEKYDNAEFIFILKQDLVAQQTFNPSSTYVMGTPVNFTLHLHNTVLTFEDYISQFLTTSESSLNIIRNFLKVQRCHPPGIGELVEKYNLLNIDRFETLGKQNFSEDNIWIQKGGDYLATYLLIYVITKEDGYDYYIGEGSI